MNQLSVLALMPRVTHRHGDHWVELETSPAHDSAESDPERQWARGRLYVCGECDEQVRVDLDRDDRTTR